jgi:hypothetical protein
MNNKKIIILFFYFFIIKIGFTQSNAKVLTCDEDFYKEVDCFIEKAALAGQVLIDTSEQKASIFFEIVIDSKGSNHSVNAIKYHGIVFLTDFIDSLCNWIKENLTFNYMMEITPEWRFVNDVCTYHFPYNYYRENRNN